MIAAEVFYNQLKKQDINLFVGVPDSLLKDFCGFVNDNSRSSEHIICANEGNAIAIASGYYLSTNKIACVYMQNSGLGNAINPLVSIADEKVYKIPMLLIIGFRGEPNIKDEPQHVKQGAITESMLQNIGVPYFILDKNTDLDNLFHLVKQKIKETGTSVAILVKKGSFLAYKPKKKVEPTSSLLREEALDAILALAKDSVIVSTTGKTSREVFELRQKRGEEQRDFLTVGGMGHTSSIALGVALGKPNKQVICIDGDGSMLMHLGSMPVIASVKPSNLVHILLNNGAHESVGGQATVANNIDFKALSLSVGYKKYFCAQTSTEINNIWPEVIKDSNGPTLFEIKIKLGSRDNLGRPTCTPIENKESFMKACL